MEAVILGCGEAFDERLPNTSILLRAGATWLLDCGYSVPPQIWRAVPGADAIDILYLSHPHADHYFGLPALLGRMWEDGRTRPLAILGQRVVLEQARQLVELGYRGLAARFAYPIEWRDISAGKALELAGATVHFAPTTHSAPNLAIRIEQADLAFCYSGDGMFTGASAELCRSANLVVHEAYAFEPLPIHTDIPRLIEMAAGQRAQRLALVHVQRSLRRDPDRIARALAETGGRVSMPEPLCRIAL